MNVLAIDIGGTSVKILASGETERRKFPSGPTLTPEKMVEGVRDIASGWTYQVIAMGYPGPVVDHQPRKEPTHLAPGWVGFDFETAFGLPVRIINDAAMQALGSYDEGRLLFLGLGTGLGSAMVIEGLLQPMELGHLPYRHGSFEDYVGVEALAKRGKKKWRQDVADVVARLSAALQPTDIVLGGGNVKELKVLPHGCRMGGNAHAFVGGFRLWEGDAHGRT